MIVSLCGFMGAGKSTIGKHLSNTLGFKFIDLDNYIEQQEGCSVTDFFAKNGEQKFRETELKALEEIFKNNNSDLILSLGGGTLTQSECVKLVKQNSVVVYLYCTEDELYRRLIHTSKSRPLLAGKTNEQLREHIKNLVAQREDIYNSAANFIVDTTQWSVKSIVERVISLLPAYTDIEPND